MRGPFMYMLLIELKDKRKIEVVSMRGFSRLGSYELEMRAAIGFNQYFRYCSKLG